MRDSATHARHAAVLLRQAIVTPSGLADLSVADWNLLIRVGRRARVLARIDADVVREGLVQRIPAEAANHLRAARYVAAHRQTLVRWEINRVLWALRDIEVSLLLLKGAAYMIGGLPPAPGRLFADLDLLVPQAQIEIVERALVEHGWLRMKLDPYDDRYYRVWMHEIPPLRHRERKTEIDLHHTILPLTSRFKPDPALLIAAARPLDVENAMVLAPTDMVLHSLVHLFLEGDPDEGLRLRDLVDVRDLLAYFSSEPEFWDLLVPRARKLGLQRPLYYGLRYVQRLLGASIPGVVSKDVQSDGPPRPIQWLMDFLVPLAMLPEHPDFPRRRVAVARWLMYIRAHWLRMPPLLLARHLSYKAWLRLRGVRRGIDLSQLDIKQ